MRPKASTLGEEGGYRPHLNGFYDGNPLGFGVRRTLGGASPDTSQCRPKLSKQLIS